MKRSTVALLLCALSLPGCAPTKKPVPILSIGAPGMPADTIYRIPWPTDANGHLLSGTTKVLALVDATGHVKDIRLDRSSGYKQLDDAAIEGVRRWIFNPGIHNGVPTGGYARIPINMDPALRNPSTDSTQKQ